MLILSVSSPEAPYLDGGQERSGAVSSPTKRPDPGREVVVNVVGKNVRYFYVRYFTYVSNVITLATF